MTCQVARCIVARLCVPLCLFACCASHRTCHPFVCQHSQPYTRTALIAAGVLVYWCLLLLVLVPACQRLPVTASIFDLERVKWIIEKPSPHHFNGNSPSVRPLCTAMPRCCLKNIKLPRRRKKSVDRHIFVCKPAWCTPNKINNLVRYKRKNCKH